MTILTSLGLMPPEPYVVKKLLASPPIGADPSLLYGVELEIEGCNPDDWRSHCVPGMEYHEDGSLRNNGAEYVTRPMAMRELVYVLDQFFKKNNFTESNYSERCSVHVHVNVGDLEVVQVTGVLLLYQVYERCLFEWIGNDRDKNIFCVPWYTTNIPYSILTGDQSRQLNKWRRWQKYTALNLLPIFTQGTIEFRHMAGTNDLNKIIKWCNIIGKMVSYMRKRKDSSETAQVLMELNTNSQYDSFTQQLFDELALELFALPNYKENMEDGVINMKYSLTEEKPSTVKNYNQQEEAGLVIFNDFFQNMPEPVEFADVPRPVLNARLQQEALNNLRNRVARPQGNEPRRR